MLLLISTTGCVNVAKNNSKNAQIIENDKVDVEREVVKEVDNNAKMSLDEMKSEEIEQGNLKAFTKNENGYNYLIIRKDGVETVVDKAPDDPKKEIADALIFNNLEFSKNGKYLKYSAYGWEWMLGRVYDIENNKRLFNMLSAFDFEFMNNGEFLFACAEDDFVGEYYAKVFKAPNFDIYNDVEIDTSTPPVDIECKYLKDENVFVVSQMDNEKGGMVEVERVDLNPIINEKQFKEFSYSDFGNNFEITSREFKVLDIFNAEELYDSSCIKEKGLEYFKKVLSAYNREDKGIEYQIEYNKPSQPISYFTITVIPNKLYKSIENFQSDFSICAAGGLRYPHLQSEKYLLFVPSCGSGFSDDSGLPIGCDEVKNIIESTIKLK